MSRSSAVILTIVAIIIIAAGVWFVFFKHKSQPPVETPPSQATSTAPAVETYASSTLGLSLSYPPGYTVNESYAYTQFPKKPIHGVSFTVPATMTQGTNLSSDTYLSIEELPNAKACTADIFIPANVKAQSMTDGSVTYSVASSSDAGAGNRYEETVYAFADSKPCTAVRYFVHYGAIENYPASTTQAFNRDALMSDFDSIRRSIVLSR